MSKVTLIDIAAKVGVSSVTVHNALSGNKGVSDELRQKIQAVADELGYTSKSAPSRTNVPEQRSYKIGIIIAEKYVDNALSFYSMMYQETSIIATRVNCSTMLEILSDEGEENLTLPEIVQQKKVHGLLLLGTISNSYVTKLRAETQLPMVCLDFYDKAQSLDSVIADNFYGMYHMTNYLFEMGHKKIGFVGTISSSTSITDRYLGYVKSLLEHGVSVDSQLIIDDRGEDGRMIEFKLPEKMPTAFSCNCDLVAGKLINQLQASGYRVPEDISVVGFDNFILEGICDVPITTYEIDIQKMALIALGKLIDRIKDSTSEEGCMEIVTGKMVVKNSVVKN